MKFAMEDQTLVTLGNKSQTESDDLGELVKQLFDAAEPLASGGETAPGGGDRLKGRAPLGRRRLSLPAPLRTPSTESRSRHGRANPAPCPTCP